MVGHVSSGKDMGPRNTQRFALHRKTARHHATIRLRDVIDLSFSLHVLHSCQRESACVLPECKLIKQDTGNRLGP